MTYHRVTMEERRLIYRWSREGLGIREIGRRLGRVAGSISRELARNSGKKGYRPKQADWKAQERAKRPGPRRFTDAVRLDAEKRLRGGWTPEIISARARMEGRAWVCKETIYKHIYAKAKVGDDLWKCLPRAHRKRKRRCPRLDGRGRGKIPNQRMIDTRPAEVETRTVVGHWEGDLVNGMAKTGNLVTAVERKTRFTLLGRTDSKEADEVTAMLVAMFLQLPESVRTGLTLDNGKEFASHEELSRAIRLDVFFARPYHSWERGTNENVNGLIRRLYPKQSSFAGIGEAELNRIERFLNDRPRKCLGWKTPREEMAAFLASAP
jgi:transposase, IS30 family